VRRTKAAQVDTGEWYQMLGTFLTHLASQIGSVLSGINSLFGGLL
jgi:hypothetical protein